MRWPTGAWYKGARGEWYVVVQLALFALILLAPRNGTDWPEWPPLLGRSASIAGAILLVIGAALLLAGFLRLGTTLTPLPYPAQDAVLHETGPYRLVRHPIYSGGILMAFGWALRVHGLLTLLYAAMLFVFVDIKARREERWLRERFSGYGQYQKRVRKFVPFIY